MSVPDLKCHVLPVPVSLEPLASGLSAPWHPAASDILRAMSCIQWPKPREPMASSFSSSVESRLRPGIQAGSQQRGISNIPFPSILTCGLDLAASEKQGWSIPGGTKLPFGPLSFRLRNSINIANMWSQGIVPVRKRLPNASAQYLVLKAK